MIDREDLVIEYRDPAPLKPYDRNARTHSPDQVRQIRASMDEFGNNNPIALREDGTIGAGHGRQLAALLPPAYERVPTITLRGLTEDQWRAYVIADNKLALNAGWDFDLLKAELGEIRATGIDLSLTGFPAVELAEIGVDGYALGQQETAPKVKLSDKFGVAPLSVLNAREGWWQARKKAWLSLGIESEVGRGENLLKMSDTMRQPDAKKRADGDVEEKGTSIFDPVLAELAYRWFCPPGGEILDPFAGGSVRGIVAAKLKRGYTGIDLRAEQCAANYAQAATILNSADLAPTWIEGDSQGLAELIERPAFDFLFSCPPYLWLEKYSDDPRDLSTMDLKGFADIYYKIIAASVARLAPDRFACFVVGDVRDKKGNYVDFPGMTIDAFEGAGASLYNDAILITAVGSLAMRAGRAFETTRKLGNTHQRVLVFVKGDPRKATAAIGKVDFGAIEGAEMVPTTPAAAEAPRKSRQAPGEKYGEKLESLGGEIV